MSFPVFPSQIRKIITGMTPYSGFFATDGQPGMWHVCAAPPVCCAKLRPMRPHSGECPVRRISNLNDRRKNMKKFWLSPCCVLGLLLCAGTSHAAFWQVIHDTPVRAEPDTGSKVLAMARKGWIVKNDVTQRNSGLQWLKVWELERHAGEGMAYAHLIYQTPGEPVYISAADAVEVADENGTPMKKDKVASATDAATARGVSVNPLPAPKAADLACNGAVDEAALKTALESWIQKCNAVIGSYEGMDTDKAAEELLAWTNHGIEGSSLEDVINDVESVENTVRSLLERWLETQYRGSMTVLSADDRKILDVLATYGLKTEITEGCPFLMADLTTLRKRISFNPPVAAYTAYIALLETQPQILFSDGGCRHSVKEMGTWAVQWEQYLKTVHADSFYFIKGNERYLEFATYILFSDLPNTPAFPEYNQGKMDDAWMQDLERVAAENPGTKTAGLITEFLEKVKANGNKLAPSTQKALSGKLNKLLVPKSTAASRPSAAEEKLLGKHMFSLQWIEGPMGEATVSRTENGGMRINAKQEHNGDYVTLNGDVCVLDGKTFLVKGDMATRVSFIAGGMRCARTGEFVFEVKGNRKYWRLQQMLNPCESVTDYVDVYFKGI